jgi:thimet oligopeptidase
MSFTEPVSDDPEALRSRARAALAAAQAEREAFATGSGGSADEVVAAFDRIVAPLDGQEGWVHVARNLHPSADMRRAAAELEQEFAAFRTGLSLDTRVFARLRDARPETCTDPEARRVGERSLADFRRAGVDLPEEQRARVEALQAELVALGQAFDRNIVEGGRTIRVAGGHADLDGLPADFLKAHPEDADGSVTLGTDPAERIAISTFANNDEVRRQMHVAALNRAVPDNLTILPELLAKRHELAQLLGYRSWADYITEDKMSRSAEEVRSFVGRVCELSRPRALAEIDELVALKREEDPRATRLFEWQRLYWVERAKQRKFDADGRAARPYFSYDAVRDGVLATSAELFGVTFNKRDDVPVWHESVECYEIEKQGRVVARFFLDMHPRDGKYKHAAMSGIQSGIAGESLPQATLMCNFPRTTASDPGLMMHDTVTTYFHEFGHLLHHLFGGSQRFLSHSGIATEWDFVEVPSQLYEEWAWETGVLQKFAKHHETGEPIPDELVAKLRAAEEYGKGLHALVQMVYATICLEFHDTDPAGFNPVQEMIAIRERLLPVPCEEGTYMVASFGHLHGYSAMYYTYMWSLVIAKDLRAAFSGDLMEASVAERYRLSILEPGGRQDAADLVEDFLGRPYDFSAFEAWLTA